MKVKNGRELGLSFWKKDKEILEAVKTGRCLIKMPTGTGKTTQIGQLLHEAGYTKQGQVYISVPTRVLAAELARRVAAEMGVELGSLVGYQVRGEQKVSSKTKIIFMTEGTLRGKIRRNPLLAGVRVVILDEFHQRSLMGDFNAALIERAQDQGSNTALVLMSATVDTDKLANHFNCKVVDGSDLDRTYPIKREFIEYDGDRYEAAADFAEKMLSIGQGNGLIFMPGKAEIETTIQKLLAKRFGEEVRILPLHSELQGKDRSEPFEDYDGVTITVATNIVETGATLPGIGWVCDSGLAKQVAYNPLSDISSLKVRKIARDRIEQRVGRCGRQRDGIAGCLYSEEDYESRPAETQPEIFLLPLRQVVIIIKSLGLSRIGKPLRLIDSPDKTNWKQAKLQLQQFGFVEKDDEANITELGRKAVELGCDPREAVMLLTAVDLGCAREMAIAISALQSKRLLISPENSEDKAYAARAHNAFTFISSSDAWIAVQIVRNAEKRKADQSLGSWCKENWISYRSLREVMVATKQLLFDLRQAGLTVNEEPGKEVDLRKAVFTGLRDRILQRNGIYSQWYTRTDGSNQEAQMSRNSLVNPRISPVVAGWEIIEISTGRGLLRLISNAVRVEKEWLES